METILSEIAATLLILIFMTMKNNGGNN